MSLCNTHNIKRTAEDSFVIMGTWLHWDCNLRSLCLGLGTSIFMGFFLRMTQKNKARQGSPNVFVSLILKALRFNKCLLRYSPQR